MKVLLIVEVEGLKDKTLFEKYLKKEGFTPIENEIFAYEGNATTHLNSTRAYILEILHKALKITSFSTCKIIFQVGENPLEAYVFNKNNNNFKESKI